MFNTAEELKEFIIWARAQKIKRIKVDKIEVEISDIAFIDDIGSTVSKPSQTDNKEIPENAQNLNGEDPDLFWSSNQ